ncbi:hypothetical protein [Mycobacterium sp. URHB0021]
MMIFTGPSSFALAMSDGPVGGLGEDVGALLSELSRVKNIVAPIVTAMTTNKTAVPSIHLSTALRFAELGGGPHGCCGGDGRH